MSILVSIIIPVYNGQKWIKDCLDSCLNQTYENLEIVVVNDGSTDGTQALLDNYSKSNDKIKIKRTRNFGIVAARELGLKISSGDFLFYLDIDDHIVPSTIELLMKEQVKGNTDCVIGQYYIDLEGEIKETRKYHLLGGDNSVIRSFLMQKLPFTLWPILFRKEVFNNVEFVKDINVGEDFLLTCQIFSNENITVSVISERVLYYVRHDSSITKVNDKYKTADNFKAYNGGIDIVNRNADISLLQVELCYNRMIFLYSSLFINSPYLIDIIEDIKKFTYASRQAALRNINFKRKLIISLCIYIPYFSILSKNMIFYLKKLRRLGK